jgi:hypothetical protein
MKMLIALILFSMGTGFAADSGEALADPKTLLKVITAIESSKIDELTSQIDEQGTSYHLKKVSFLGTVNRSGKIYTIAHATYVRSSPPGRETPPARGHDFIVVFDSHFKICGVGRTTFGEYYMQGETLYHGTYDEKNEPCADFGSTEALIRYRGFINIGLDYPFPDRISEEDWQSGAFLKSLSEEDKNPGLYPKQ